MATYDLDRSTLSFFHGRISRLTPASRRLWGEMDLPRALRHLTYAIEMSLGEQDVKDSSVPVVRDLLFAFAFRWFTNWPKGRLKAPAHTLPPAQGDVEAERAALVDRLWRFVDLLEREPDRRAVSPGLGSIPLTKWSRVHGVHLDHHLRQFGV
jgi:hypothetical protein